MKQYKRIIAVLSLGLVLTLGVTACNNNGNETTKQTDTTASSETTPSTTAPVQTEAPTEAPTEPQSEDSSEDSSEAQSEAPESGDEASDEQSGNNSGQEERYFFDEEGNTIYTTENSDGNWVDEAGTVYTFLENGVEDSNGTKYYYDPPSYRQNNNQSSDDSGGGTSDGTVVNLYTKDGSLKVLRENSDGVWADGDGVTYELRDDGAQDSNGTFHPW